MWRSFAERAVVGGAGICLIGRSSFQSAHSHFESFSCDFVSCEGSNVLAVGGLEYRSVSDHSSESKEMMATPRIERVSVSSVFPRVLIDGLPLVFEELHGGIRPRDRKYRFGLNGARAVLLTCESRSNVVSERLSDDSGGCFFTIASSYFEGLTAPTVVRFFCWALRPLRFHRAVL
jgi:hypothetical protein